MNYNQIKTTVISEDPSDKVFKGYYSDVDYSNLLTSSKEYQFNMEAGVEKQLYLRYSPKPITITFNPTDVLGTPASYTVTGSFGTVTVENSPVVKEVEFLEDTDTKMNILFSSCTPLNTPNYEINSVNITLEGISGLETTSHVLPYTVSDITPGKTIGFTPNITIADTTSTTSTSTLPPPILTDLGLSTNGVEADIRIENITTGMQTEINLSIDNGYRITAPLPIVVTEYSTTPTPASNTPAL